MKITSLLMCFLKVPKTTLELTYELMNVIPNNAIDEHLVYEALREWALNQEEKPLVYFGTSNEKIIYNQPIG
jgi:hypothetical protein